MLESGEDNSERERETDRQTDRDRDRETEREGYNHNSTYNKGDLYIALSTISSIRFTNYMIFVQKQIVKQANKHKYANRH